VTVIDFVMVAPEVVADEGLTFVVVPFTIHTPSLLTQQALAPASMPQQKDPF
jgi:hypothetical protein